MPKFQKPFVGKRPNIGIRKPSRDEVVALIKRRMKRSLIEQGVIQDPATRPPRYRFDWTYGELSGSVYADDRSTARAMIKRELGIRKKHRLPVAVEITREHNIEREPE